MNEKYWAEARKSNICIGEAVVPFDPKMDGWIQAGCGVIKSRNKAIAYAKRLNALIKECKPSSA